MAAPKSGKIDLRGQVAIITGAARGIGRAVALSLAREGADIVASDILSVEETVSMVKQMGRSAIGILCDVTKPEDVQRMVQRTEEEYGKVDILATCAGVCERTIAENVSPEEWDFVLRVNLKGTFLCMQAVYPKMKERVYCKIVAIGSYNVYVNAVAPGPVHTDMTVGWPYQDDMSPLQRLGEPEDIAESVVFLASQASNWITGLTLDVNGGMLMT
jgi:3-oxoacyl-[acyl-carrier protein] reductase